MRDIPDAGLDSARFEARARGVENFVDNLALRCNLRSRQTASRAPARKEGIENFMNINGLRRAVVPGHGAVVCRASAGAAVELSDRARPRFADG